MQLHLRRRIFEEMPAVSFPKVLAKCVGFSRSKLRHIPIKRLGDTPNTVEMQGRYHFFSQRRILRIGMEASGLEKAGVDGCRESNPVIASITHCVIQQLLCQWLLCQWLLPRYLRDKISVPSAESTDQPRIVSFLSLSQSSTSQPDKSLERLENLTKCRIKAPISRQAEDRHRSYSGAGQESMTRLIVVVLQMIFYRFSNVRYDFWTVFVSARKCSLSRLVLPGPGSDLRVRTVNCTALQISLRLSKIDFHAFVNSQNSAKERSNPEHRHLVSLIPFACVSEKAETKARTEAKP